MQMKIVGRRSILIIGVCCVFILSAYYTLEVQYLLAYNNVQLPQYFVFKSRSSDNINNDTLINLQDFEYILNNASICKHSALGDPSSIVIIIHSARSHFNERYAIRGTWGSVKFYRGWLIHLAFLLGNDPTSDEEFEARLWKESTQHGDIIMGNFVDSYHNLTYKHLMGYKWVNSFCSNARYILKADDDIFVDIFKLVEVILVELIDSDKTYACQNMGGNKPIREKGNPWYVSEDLYSEEQYPDFCSGSVYLVKAKDAAKIYSVCNQTKFFWIDDVYVTGILREHYNTLIENDDFERLDILSMNNRYNLSCRNEIKLWHKTGLYNHLQYTFVLLNKDEIISDMFSIWNKVRLLKFAMNNAIALERN